ncbi:hypothetical protein EJ08DRAFT_627812 [Tothia fuscella]|uniref:Uncharacterized protein n=1 Tax=Tothia fuscella TaxID=1048955 RepID=A0A9P4NZ23_9PEZI|nr:hypothetical protein EJ08DRAFT_627812 [Tothia fuscella]
MHFTNTAAFTILVTLATVSTAVPLEETSSTNAIAEGTQVGATARAWHGDLCHDLESSTTLTGSGSYRCVAVGSSRSISADRDGCRVATYSGNNCRGSKFSVPDNACHSVLFGSYEVSC